MGVGIRFRLYFLKFEGCFLRRAFLLMLTKGPRCKRPDDFQRIGYCYRDVIVDLRYCKPVEHPSWRWSSEYEVGKRGTPTYTDRCCSGPGGMRDHTACSRYVRRDLNSLDMRPELKWDPQPTMAVEFLDAVLSCVVDVPPLEDIRARADEEGNEPS